MIGFILLFILFGLAQLAYFIAYSSEYIDDLSLGKKIPFSAAWVCLPGLVLFPVVSFIVMALDDNLEAFCEIVPAMWDAWKRSAGLSS